MTDRLSPDELMALQARETPIVIDVRDADRYAAGHVPGALHIPLAEIERQVPDLPHDRPIITY